MATALAPTNGVALNGFKGKVDADWCPGCGDFAFEVIQCYVVGSCQSRRHLQFSSNLISSNLISSNQDFMCRYRELGFATQLFLYCFDDVVRHEWFPILLSYVSISHEAGFPSQVAGELAAVVVLHNDCVPRVFQNFENRVAMQRHEPADLELVGRNALLGEDFAGLLDHAHGRSPADQRDIGIARAP